jgi:hypothetical protein
MNGSETAAGADSHRRRNNVSNVCDIYVKGIKEKLRNYWSAWLPNSRFDLGDVGILNGYYFEKVASLGELDIPFEPRRDESPSPLELVSSAGVSLAVKLAGETNGNFETVPSADAGIKVDFAKEGSFVVESPETFEDEIAAPMALQEAILKAQRDRLWQSNWLVVVRLVRAPVATFLISQSQSSGIELSAKADFQAGFADLGNAGLGIALRSQRGEMIKMIGSRDVTPFFQLAGLKRRLFGTTTLTTRALRVADHRGPGILPKSNSDDPTDLYLDVLRDDEVAG